MKIFLKIALLVLVSQTVCLSQNTLLGGSNSLISSYGDELFKAGKYDEALENYSKEIKNNPDKSLELKIADCYRALNDHEQASYWYKEGLDGNKEADPEFKLKLAQSLTTMEKYDEAKNWYQEYRLDKPNSTLAKNKLEGFSHIDWFYYDTLIYNIEPLAASSRRSEFSPSWYKDGLVFVVSDKKGSKVNYQSDYNLVFSKVKKDKSLSSPKKFTKVFNTKFQEGPIAFYNSQTSAIFTRTNVNEGKAISNRNNVAALELYSTSLENGKWSKIKRLPLCADSYSSGHPAISEDGLIMIYSSNRPGGEGGTDLYLSKFQKGHWQEGVELGSNVNTSGDEVFPTLHKGILYFATDGLEGLGGLDVYKIRLDNLEKGTPLNLGYPINTSKDDFGILYESNWKGGYVSSNRKGGKGNDDIYHFTINLPKTLTLQGGLKDLNNHPHRDTKVTVLENGSLVNSSMTDSDGHFEVEVPYGEHNYELQFEDENFGKKTEEVALDSSMFSLRPVLYYFGEQLMYSGTLTLENGRTPVSGASIVMTEKKSGKVVKTSSKIDGFFQVPVNKGNSYDLLITKKSFFTIHSDVLVTEKELDNNNLLYKFKKIEVGRVIKLDKIYYNVNSAQIRQDAKAGLDHLVNMLKDNPNMRIELNSHTDSRGDAEANLFLSQKRAEAVVDYIAQNGISRSRMTAKGYGETLLLNGCKDKVDCSLKEHQLNRRTEFKILDF